MATSSSVSTVTIPDSVCSRCGKPVRSQWALRMDDRVVHTRCDEHTLRFVEGLIGRAPFTCQECQNPVSGGTCKRIGHQIYHDQCLKCAACHRMLDESVCYQVDVKHFCIQCQHKTENKPLSTVVDG